MTKIIIVIVLTCLLAGWTSLVGFEVMARVPQKYKIVCYLAPIPVIILLLKLALMYF